VNEDENYSILFLFVISLNIIESSIKSENNNIDEGTVQKYKILVLSE
jgi:hypothetical protein